MRKPFYRSQVGAWYVWHGGRQVFLCRAPSRQDRAGHARALAEWHRLLSTELDDGPLQPTLVAVLEAFLVWSRAHHAAATYRWYRDYLQSFLEFTAAVVSDELTPHHVTRWLQAAGGSWGDAGQRGAITALKRALNWATEQALIPANPLASVRRPPATRREQLVSDEHHRRMLAASDPPFRRLLVALRQLGCRPIEARTVTAADVNWRLGAWVFPLGHPANKTGGKTSKPRIVYLSPCAAKLTRWLAIRHPTGVLFRNSVGAPWTGNAVRCRMRRLREKLGLPPITAYSYRHTYATDGLEAGVRLATMAELLGHADSTMLSRCYGHLETRAEHLRAAAAQASRRKPAGTDPPNS